MIKALKKLLTGTKPDSIKPEPRAVYAVTGGTYVGECFVYIERIKGDFMFISLPEMEIRSVPYDKWILGARDNIVDKIEDLPADVYTLCEAQYRKNIDSL